MIVNCDFCGNKVEKTVGHVNRSKKLNNNIYCDRECSGLGRGMSKKEKIENKRLYDIQYRDKNNKKIANNKKKYYIENKKEIYKKQRKVRDNDESREEHAKYCRQPEQREKEKIRRWKREYGDNYAEKTKHCIACNEDKHIFEFQSFPVFPDGRRHICDDCEKFQEKEYGYSTRGTMTAMVIRRYTNLTREDIAKHPYLIEANKFLILLKQLLK